MNKKKRIDHLFVCYTPLHILIAKKIIELENIKDYILLFYYENDTIVLRNYYKRLQVNAAVSYWVKKNNKKTSLIFHLLPIYFKVRRKLTKNAILYSGQLKTIYTRLPFYITKIKKIHSFDDGFGNISKNGYFFKGRERQFHHKIMRFFKLDFSYSYLIRFIEKHYTIYPNLENALPNCVPINPFVFVKNHDNNKPLKESCKILLMAPFFEHGMMEKQSEYNLYDRIINQYKIDYVITHPRSCSDKHNRYSTMILHETMIAEETISKLNKMYREVFVYGFMSSALVNLVAVEGVKCFSFDTVILGSEDSKKIMEQGGVEFVTFNYAD